MAFFALFRFCSLHSVFLNFNLEEIFGFPVDSFDFRDQMGFLPQLISNSVCDGTYDVLNCPMLEHHFLVMTFGLVSSPGLDEPAHVSKHPQTFPFLLGFENSSEVREVTDIGIVFQQIPAVKLKIAFTFFYSLQQLPALMARQYRLAKLMTQAILTILHYYFTIQQLLSSVKLIFMLQFVSQTLFTYLHYFIIDAYRPLPKFQLQELQKTLYRPQTNIITIKLSGKK